MGGLIHTEALYVRLTPGEPIPDVSSLAPFKAIIALEAGYPSDWQDEVSQWLVASGCRYMMAWGPDCSTWDDSVDMADIEGRNFEEDDSKFVMTTWHTDETLEEVFWYSQFCANFSYDEIELTRALIVHVGIRDRHKAMLWLFERSRTLAERQTDDEDAITSSTHLGTRSPAGPIRLSWKKMLPWLGSKFISRQ
jgi:hypothetical protein